MLRNNHSDMRIAAAQALLMVLALHPASSAAEADPIQEVVVTAQKRAQNLQDVPISVAALSGEAMSELGVINLQDVAQQIPNVAMHSTSINQFSIRGVQLQDFGDSNEPPVAVYIDEIYLGTLAAQQAAAFDIERVEVLRGPQGTLFGRNATGGLVHFITRKPTRELTANASLSYGSYDQRIFEAGVGGPLSERVRGRIAVNYNEDEGWQDNVLQGGHTAVTDMASVRAMLDIDATDNLRMLVSGHYSDQQSIRQVNGMVGTGDPLTGALCPVERIAAGECISFGFASTNSDPTQAFTDVPSEGLGYDVEALGGFVKLDWTLGTLQLVSISGYDEVEKSLFEDSDVSALPLFLTQYTVDARQFSEELRLSGSSGRADWVLGAFYLDDRKEDIGFLNPQAAPLFGTVGVNTQANLDTESWAVFSQWDFRVGDAVTLTAGARYTEETKEILAADSLSNPTPPFPDTAGLKDDNVSFKVGASWHVSDDVMTYASVSRGFKSGAFNTGFLLPGFTGQVDPEELTNHEIGVKSDLLGRRLRLNLAMFYSDYRDFQAVQTLLVNGAVGGRLVNVGDADIYGLEADATVRMTDRLELALGLGLLDTEIQSADPLLDGNDLTHAPPVSLSGVLRYEMPAQVFGGTISLHTSVSYMDDHSVSIRDEPHLAQDAYTLVGAGAAWTSADQRYSVEVSGKNLLDEEYTTAAYDVTDWAARVWGTPRWVSVKLGFRY